MTSEKTDKLKLFADEIRSRLRVIETKQDHQESLINAINLKLANFDEKSLSTDNLKTNYKDFTMTFNDTIKNVHSELDTIRKDSKLQVEVINDNIADLKNSANIASMELKNEIKLLKSMLDF